MSAGPASDPSAACTQVGAQLPRPGLPRRHIWWLNKSGSLVTLGTQLRGTGPGRVGGRIFSGTRQVCDSDEFLSRLQDGRRIRSVYRAFREVKWLYAWNRRGALRRPNGYMP